MDRKPLGGPVTLGRAQDCDLSLHDILLSRHHCRIEPSGRGWVLLDLRSKNGTWLDGQRVGRRSLRHGDVFRMGKTTVRFMMGELAEAGSRAPNGKIRPARPADPFESLAGTVVDLAGTVVDFDPKQIEEAGEASAPRISSRMPYPRPVPPEPAAYSRDGLYTLLEEIASSSWDSIYANASRPTRPTPRAAPVALPGQGGNTATAVMTEVERPAAVRRPASPIRRTLPPTSVPDTIPARASSRHQVDLSLQAPVVRPARAVRTRAPSPVIVTPPARTSSRGTGGSVMRRAWRAFTLPLLMVHRRIAPQGAIILL